MNRVVLGVIIAGFILSLTTPVSASSGLACTEDGNLRHNITDIDASPQTEWVWIENCEGNGCRQTQSGVVCATPSFVIPMELYIMFEIIAFIFLFITLVNFRESDRGQDNIIFPLMGLILFSALGIMSMNLVGMEFLMGAALNGSMALLSLLYVMIIGVEIWTGRGP